MVKTVVILGAAYGGLAVAHRLLKYTRKDEQDLRVILVSKVRHVHMLIGRATGSPDDHCRNRRVLRYASDARGEAAY